MTPNKEKSLSKFISLILRHKPEEVGLKLDEYGYLNTKDLINGINSKGYNITMADLEIVVSNDNKQRYSFNEDKTKIRANQGHSVKVNLELVPIEPPNELYHGTATRFIESILREGITKQTRQNVHLSADIQTATKVGERHGKLAILIVDSATMHADGYKFYLSDNKVWLTDIVPTKYIRKYQPE